MLQLHQAYNLCNAPCRKMPERESDHLTPATRLLEKRREMSEVETALATQKEVQTTLYHYYYC